MALVFRDTKWALCTLTTGRIAWRIPRGMQGTWHSLAKFGNAEQSLIRVENGVGIPHLIELIPATNPQKSLEAAADPGPSALINAVKVNISSWALPVRNSSPTIEQLRYHLLRKHHKYIQEDSNHQSPSPPATSHKRPAEPDLNHAAK